VIGSGWTRPSSAWTRVTTPRRSRSRPRRGCGAHPRRRGHRPGQHRDRARGPRRRAHRPRAVDPSRSRTHRRASRPSVSRSTSAQQQRPHREQGPFARRAPFREMREPVCWPRSTPTTGDDDLDSARSTARSPGPRHVFDDMAAGRARTGRGHVARRDEKRRLRATSSARSTPSAPRPADPDRSCPDPTRSSVSRRPSGPARRGPGSEGSQVPEAGRTGGLMSVWRKVSGAVSRWWVVFIVSTLVNNLFEVGRGLRADGRQLPPDHAGGDDRALEQDLRARGRERGFSTVAVPALSQASAPRRRIPMNIETTFPPSRPASAAPRCRRELRGVVATSRRARAFDSADAIRRTASRRSRCRGDADRGIALIGSGSRSS